MTRALHVWLFSLLAAAQVQAGSSGRSVPPGARPPGIDAARALPIPGVWSLPLAPAGRASSPPKLSDAPPASAPARAPHELPSIPGLGGLEAARGLRRGLDGDSRSPDAALGGAFDGASSFREPPHGPPVAPAEANAEGFLDAQLRAAREALRRGREDIPRALAHLETIAWAAHYFEPAAYDAWIARRRARLGVLDGWLVGAVRASVEGEIAAGDTGDARERILELRRRHAAWSDAHAELLAELSLKLPPEDRKSEPRAPVHEAHAVAELAMAALGGGELRRAEYLLTALEREHPRWAAQAQNAAWLASARQSLLEAIHAAFEGKKLLISPVDLRRLAEYAQAASEGRNLAYGFEQPQRQDPYSLMCTILSIYNAIKASIGFEDPQMTIARFTELVRRVLGDPTLGDTKGLSTHRVRVLMKELGLRLRVVEMQERLRRPFKEAELVELIKPGQVVLPVFIIAQFYEDEKGLQREEHKGFLRDAYFSRSEDRWVYLVADPLIGRVSFYDWTELRSLLHKLFVIRTDKPLK